MNKILGLSLLLGLLFLSGCAITHEYGPYMGKVVEKGSGEPIEGAVVFLQFYTGAGDIGGMTSYYADAVETLTNVKGEFLVPKRSIYTFRILSGWVEDAKAIVFKPGHGAFPRNRNTKLTPHAKPDWTIPANTPMVIELPRLNTKEERLESLHDAGGWDMGDVPCEKQRFILKLYNSERIAMGFEPEMKNTCGGLE